MHFFLCSAYTINIAITINVFKIQETLTLVGRNLLWEKRHIGENPI